MPGSSIDKILVIRLSSLGDILLTSPIIRALHVKYPDAKIDFMIKIQFADAYRYNPIIKRLMFFEKESIENLRQDLIASKYDLIIDLQNNWRSHSFIRGTEAKIVSFRKPTFRKFLLVWLKLNFLKERKSIVERYAEAVPDLILDGKSLDLYFACELITYHNSGTKNIGLCPGSRHFTKRWPPEYFVELGNNLVKAGYKIVLFGGSSDKELCMYIAAQIKECINLQNDDQLLQTAADMKMCDLIITNDSGLMHTASAVGVPIVAIFGSSVQEFGFAPYRAKNSILEINSLSCRPCSHIGSINCPKKHFKCMIDISPEMVLNQINKILLNL